MNCKVLGNKIWPCEAERDMMQSYTASVEFVSLPLVFHMCPVTILKIKIKDKETNNIM